MRERIRINGKSGKTGKRNKADYENEKMNRE